MDHHDVNFDYLRDNLEEAPEWQNLNLFLQVNRSLQTCHQASNELRNKDKIISHRPTLINCVS